MKKLLISAFVLGIMVAVIISVHTTEAAPPFAVDINGNLLHDGDVVSANQNAGDPDVYIIGFLGRPHPGDILGYKRLFLNPAIFNMYGHLGGFANVRQVTAEMRDSFVTSGLFRNCETNDQSVWATEVTGEDNSILHHVQMTGDQANAEDPYFFGKVFCINTREDNSYTKSITPYYRLADIPPYFRQACIVRPACLDAVPRCLPPEPIEGWCPSPTPTPPAGCYYQEVQCIQAPCYPVLVCPTPTPDTGPVTVQGVTLGSEPLYNGSVSYFVNVNGYLSTSCYTLSHILTRNGSRFDITIQATSTLGPADGACIQVIQNFSRGVTLGYDFPLGTYSVYVNGRYWIQFTK